MNVNVEQSVRSQLHGFSMLRAGLTLLVVFHHTAITYGASGGWFYREYQTNLDDLQSLAMSLFCAVDQSFFMGFFFLLAGYFTPASIRRKGARGFVADRLKRLGLPLLFFGFILGPITVALAGIGEGKGFLQVLLPMWASVDFVWGPLWFAWALILFSAGALAWHQLSDRPWKGGFPSNQALLYSALAIGAAAFLLRLVWPAGWDILGLQLGFFASYIFLFAAGYMAADRHLLESVPEEATAFWKKAAWIAFPFLPIVALGVGFVPALNGPAEGGLNIVALTYAFWEPFIAFGIILALIPWSLRRFTTLEGVNAKLARRAYTIYIIHPPVLVGVALLLHPLALPPILKFLLVGVLVCLACYLIAGIVLKIPGVKRIV